MGMHACMQYGAEGHMPGLRVLMHRTAKPAGPYARVQHGAERHIPGLCYLHLMHRAGKPTGPYARRSDPRARLPTCPSSCMPM